MTEMEKRRTRRSLLAVLAVALVAAVGFAPRAALAVDVDDGADLRTALLSTTENDTITLTEDVTINNGLKVSGTKTLDLNGHSITGDTITSVVDVPSGSSLTIRDTGNGQGSITGGFGQSGAALTVEGTLNLESGSIVTTEAASAVAVTGDDSSLNMTGGSITNSSAWSKDSLPVVQGVCGRDGAALAISGGTVGAPNAEGCGVRIYGSCAQLSGSGVIKGYYGIFLFNSNNDNTTESTPSHFEMTGGTIDCTVYAIGGNNTSSARCSATVSNGVVKSSDGEVCVYWPMEGKLTISGGTFTGGTALEIKMGELNISGGTFEGRDVYMSVFQSSAYEDGSALKIVGQQYGWSEGQYIDSSSLKVNITGGEFSSVQGNAISVYSLNRTADNSGKSLTANVTIGENAVLSSADGRDAVRVLSKNDFTVDSGAGVKTSNTTIEYAPLADAAAVAEGATSKNAGNNIQSEPINTLYTSLANAVSASGNSNVPISSVSLLRNVEEDITVPDGADVTLDLNKHTLSGSVAGDGQLKMQNGTFEGQVPGGNITAGESLTAVVAKIGDQGFSTIQDAIDKVKNGQTVTLVASVTESVAIPANKTITLDLNGFTLTNEADKDTITNSGSLTVIDTAGMGVVDNVSHGKAALSTSEGSTTVLNGGIFKRSQEAGTLDYTTGNSSANGNSYYTILNKGDLTIDDGTTVELLLADRTPAGHSSIIDNGWNSDAPTQGGYNAKLTINGGVIDGGKYIKNDSYGTLIINGGQILNGANTSILNWNTATIAGGTLDPCDEAAGVVYNIKLTDAEKGSVVISGGTFVTTGSQAPVLSDREGTANYSDDAKITGGTFEGNAPAEEYVVPGYGLNKDQNGNFGVHQHDLTLTPAKDPTCTETGNEQYWTCSECGKLFSDANGANEVTLDQVTLSATGHHLAHIEADPATGTTDGNTEYWECTVCHKYFSDEDGKSEIDPATVIVPAIKHTVTIVYGHGLANGTMQVPDGAVLSELEAPSYPGYTFVGWFTTRNADDTVEDEYDFTKPVTEDLTLYAGWVKDGEPGKTPTTPETDADKGGEKTEALAKTSDPTTFLPAIVAGAAGVTTIAGAVVLRKRQR